MSNQSVSPNIVGLSYALQNSATTKSASAEELQIEKFACAECATLYGPGIGKTDRVLGTVNADS